MSALSDWFIRRPSSVLTVAAPGARGARVLVCGASGALGAAIAAAFSAGGARVYLHGHRNLERAQALALKLQAARGDTACAASGGGDLRRAEDARLLVRHAAEAMDGLDVVVTAVGNAKDAPLPLVDAQDITVSMDDNLMPVIHVCEAFRELYAERRPAERRGGRIVNVSSVTGMVGQPMRVAYGAAKGAVVSYTKSLARELAIDGVTANVVAPQVIEGGLADLMKARVRTVLLANTPIGRTCAPEDVAHGVTYLASPAASFVTGTVLTISGGLVTW